MVYEILNKQTGEKRVVRDKAFNGKQAKMKTASGEDLYQIIKTYDSIHDYNTQKEGILQVKKLELIETPAETCAASNMPPMYAPIEAHDSAEGLEDEKTELNPYFISDIENLRLWMQVNQIEYPKTIKKIETLQNYIPEIYKDKKE